MLEKIIIPVLGDDVAPRFDMATDVQIVILSGGSVADSRAVILAQPSAEKLCHLIIAENAHTVICGGIEEEFHQYLTWKKIRVFDAVIGRWQAAMYSLINGSLTEGDILNSNKDGG